MKQSGQQASSHRIALGAASSAGEAGDPRGAGRSPTHTRAVAGGTGSNPEPGMAHNQVESLAAVDRSAEEALQVQACQTSA